MTQDTETRQIDIQLNGDPRRVPAGTTVLGLLGELGRHPRTVAVELNGDILPRERYGETHLDRGDRLEVVGFVQGGCEVLQPPPGYDKFTGRGR